MFATVFPYQISKTTSAFARAAVFLFGIMLLCIWTHSLARPAESSLAQGAESAWHAQEAGEGENPRPAAEQELVFKKRRGSAGQTSLAEEPSDAIASQPIASSLSIGITDRQCLEYATQRARQCYGFARQLWLSDPALRLHPGHAPPPATAG